jgi:hypothetical protein
LLFFEGSARSGEHIEEVFNEMARRLVKAELTLVKQMAAGDGQIPPGVSRENTEILIAEHQQRQERRQCVGALRCCH